MGFHYPFGYLNISYGQNKGRESNCQFDSRPLKVKNCRNLFACRWCATYHWKVLDDEYNFSSNLISIGGLHTNLWASKVVGVPIQGISRLQLGTPETKWHLDASPVARHKEYYEGEGGGFPQVRDVVSLVSPCLPVVRPCTKSAPTMH
jgi:hypothetical protein